MYRHALDLTLLDKTSVEVNKVMDKESFYNFQFVLLS